MTTQAKTQDAHLGQVTIRLVSLQVVTEAPALATASATANQVALAIEPRVSDEEALTEEAFHTWEESLKKRQ